MTRDLDQLRRQWRILAAEAEAAKKTAQDAQSFGGDYHGAVDAWFAADDRAFEAWLAVLEAEDKRQDGAA